MSAKKILIADDSPTIVGILEYALGNMGYEVEIANDGIEAIQKTYTFDPDLIVLDIEMPRMKGYQACRLLKHGEATKHIPIIMLTSLDQQSDRFWGLTTGADEYVVKDLETDYLFQRIDKLIAGPADREEERTPIEHREMTEIDVLGWANDLLDDALFESTIINRVGALATKAQGFKDTVNATLDLLGEFSEFCVVFLVLRHEPTALSTIGTACQMDADFLRITQEKVVAECQRYGIEVALEQADRVMLSKAEEEETAVAAVRSFLPTPLKIGDEVTGLLAIGNDREVISEKKEMRTLRIFAKQASIVLENSLSQVREQTLRRQVEKLKIEIDEAKRAKEVQAITETEFFQDLQEKARRMRGRG
jgi:CheY-like chemotaxis protein